MPNFSLQRKFCDVPSSPCKEELESTRYGDNIKFEEAGTYVARPKTDDSEFLKPSPVSLSLQLQSEFSPFDSGVRSKLKSRRRNGTAALRNEGMGPVVLEDGRKRSERESAKMGLRWTMDD